MVVTKVKQIKSVNKLADGIKYIEDGAKTIGTELIDSDLNFPVKVVDGKIVSQLVSGNLVIDVESAYSEFMMLKQLANLEKGRPINNEELVKNDVLAHHIIQSFSPEDNLTPEQVHEIGRKTALELTGGSHQFVIALTRSHSINSDGKKEQRKPLNKFLTSMQTWQVQKFLTVKINSDTKNIQLTKKKMFLS